MVDKAGVGENKINKSEMIKDHPHFRIMDKLANVKQAEQPSGSHDISSIRMFQEKNGGDEDSYMVTKVTNHSSTPHSPHHPPYTNHSREHRNTQHMGMF